MAKKAKTTKRVEPAKINYFFSGAYTDLWDTLRSLWSRNFTRIKDAFSSLAHAYRDHNWYTGTCVIIFSFFTSISIFIFGTLFSLLFSIFHIIFAIVCMCGVYLSFVILRFLDSLYRFFKSLSTTCSNPGCERKFGLGVYRCPKCGALHYKLVPNKYGILKRTCQCGAKLPTTVFNGREKLEVLCPHCLSKAINGAHTSSLIPVIGGSSAGKTCLITMGINAIGENAKNHGLDYQYQKVQGDEFDVNYDHMRQGLTPNKTGDLNFKYYNFLLTPKKHKVKNLISICDIAGEVLTNQSQMIKQQGYRFADSLILVIDPLSIPDFQREIRQNVTPTEYGRMHASSEKIDDIMSSLMTTLESMYHRKGNAKLNISIVVVFTKCDAPYLNEILGQKVIMDYQKNHKCSLTEAYNQVCSNFLKTYNEISFLNNAKGNFKELQFFTCSALGENQQNGKAFVPQGVDLPFLWAIDKVNKTINLKDIWKEKI